MGRSALPAWGVYPRVYGESRWRTSLARTPVRSIPACTGNPGVAFGSAVRQAVYPRVYGESQPCSDPYRERRGLSPRVRGIRTALTTWQRSCGSIPACTGNPWRSRRRWKATWVYPRVYGESQQRQVHHHVRRGLSPRVRGILGQNLATLAGGGSIPACTGNPRMRR